MDLLWSPDIPDIGQIFSFNEAVIKNIMTGDSRLSIVTCVEADIHAHLTQPQHQEHVQYQHPDTDQTCHDHQEFEQWKV